MQQKDGALDGHADIPVKTWRRHRQAHVSLSPLRRARPCVSSVSPLRLVKTSPQRRARLLYVALVYVFLQTLTSLYLLYATKT